MRYGLKVRFHDYKMYSGADVQCLEFHLSDKDLDIPFEDDEHYPQQLVLHAPEYWYGKLINISALEEDHRQFSRDIIQRVIDKARQMADNFTGVPKIIVHPGGASLEPMPEERDRMLENLAKSTNSLDKEGVEVLLENMPPFPWLYGGQWVQNIFMDAEEIRDFLTTHGYNMCFDISHAQLYCTHVGKDLEEYIETIKPYIRHIHVADASGVDGEGVQIEEGDIDFAKALGKIWDLGLELVPEVWYGHKNNGEGFRVAIERLKKYWPGRI